MAYTSRAEPAQARSVMEAGLAAHRAGDLEQAIGAYRNVLALSPDNAAACNLLGTALLQKGEAAQAVEWLERAARQQRNNPMLLANLAQAYLALCRYEEACRMYRKASRIEPRHVHFQLGLATALAAAAKLSEAENTLQRLAARFPHEPLVWFNLGNALRDQGKPHDATRSYGKALELEPQLVDARNNLGSVLHSLQLFEQAEAQYRACLEVAPNYSLARYNLASVVIDLGRFAEAEALCRELIAAEPGVPRAHSFLAAALAHQGRVLEALDCNRAAAQLAPADIKIAESFGANLMEAGLTGDGMRVLSGALAREAPSVGLRQLLATALLSAGCLQDGWREYGWRPAAIRFREKYPALALTRSLPQDLSGMHVCVLREQGLGDEVFFLRYAALLAARGGRITYRASNKIASMLARVPCIAAIVEESSPLPPADANLMVGDLPHALHATAATSLRRTAAERYARIPDFEHHVSLFWPQVPPSLVLQPLPDRIEALRMELTALGPPPYIGVTWRAGTPPEEQKSAGWLLYKTIALPALAATLKGVKGTLLALQRKPVSGEIDGLRAVLERPIYDFTHLNEDLESMLALLAVIDEYLGVSNTNMHLRAAVGRTARVLVPAPAEWRWMQAGAASPWFPGFSIYRQSLRGDWTDALSRLKDDLEANGA